MNGRPPSSPISGDSAVRVEDIAPFRGWLKKVAANKNGHLAFRGRASGRPVKVYEAFGVQHAGFIATISTRFSASGSLPACLGTSGRWVVAEWIRAEPWIFRPSAQPRLAFAATMLRDLHATPAGGLPEPGFDYWRDHVLPRFRRACALLGQAGAEERIRERVEPAWDGSPKVLMHGDMTLPNICRSAGGRLVVIDNEMLGTGSLPLIDLCNALYLLGPHHRRHLMDCYLPGGSRSIPVSKESLEAVAAMWSARIAGSAMMSGRVEDARTLIESFMAGRNPLMPELMDRLAIE